MRNALRKALACILCLTMLLGMSANALADWTTLQVAFYVAGTPAAAAQKRR